MFSIRSIEIGRVFVSIGNLEKGDGLVEVVLENVLTRVSGEFLKEQ